MILQYTMTENNEEPKIEEIPPRIKKRNKIKKWFNETKMVIYAVLMFPKMILIDGFNPYP